MPSSNPKVFVVEYVWIGGNKELRSKTRVIHNGDDKEEITLEDIPEWNYDGSSTAQADGKDSEIIIKPHKIYSDPFRSVFDCIVICSTYLPNGQPHITNTRQEAEERFNKNLEAKPWYGLEQEYFILDPHTRLPLGFNGKGGQGQYYCSVGADNAFGRAIAEQHLAVCIKAGVNISGINAEVAPGQWEFQVGPCEGICSGDDMMIARYLLHKIAEVNNVFITFEPKPLKGDWNGSGCHTNFSTINMRNGCDNKSGLEYIKEAISKLETQHVMHMQNYGSGNEERMTGQHETASYDKFSYGIANRGASVRIGNDTLKNNKGYFEDRRPSSNCDPYVVTSLIFETINNPNMDLQIAVPMSELELEH